MYVCDRSDAQTAVCYFNSLLFLNHLEKRIRDGSRSTVYILVSFFFFHTEDRTDIARQHFGVFCWFFFLNFCCYSNVTSLHYILQLHALITINNDDLKEQRLFCL